MEVWYERFKDHTVDLCHILSAGIYLCGSHMASYNHFLPLGWDSTPYCRTYYCIYPATISGDIWDEVCYAIPDYRLKAESVHDD